MRGTALFMVNGTECKKLASPAQSFTDQIIHFD